MTAAETLSNAEPGSGMPARYDQVMPFSLLNGELSLTFAVNR